MNYHEYDIASEKADLSSAGNKTYALFQGCCYAEALQISWRLSNVRSQNTSERERILTRFIVRMFLVVTVR